MQVNKIAAAIGICFALAAAAPVAALAQNGADDPIGHVGGADDGPSHR